MLGSLGQDLCASAFNFAAPCPFLTLADAGAEHRPHAGCSPRAATGLWRRPDPTRPRCCCFSWVSGLGLMAAGGEGPERVAMRAGGARTRGGRQDPWRAIGPGAGEGRVWRR